MQKALQEMIRNKLTSIQRIEVSNDRIGNQDILSMVMQSDMEKIRLSLEEVDREQFRQAVEAIVSARRIYILGVRSATALASFLGFYFNLIFENVVLMHTTSVSEVFEQMLRVGREDAVIGIGFPRYYMRTLKALEFANDRNAKVITITDSVHSPMCLYSSCNLFAASDMVSIVDSLVAPLSVINALVVALCLKQPQTVRESLESLEVVWNNYQVSMHDEIDRIDEDSLFTLPGAGGLRREASDEERILYTERDGQT